MASSDILSQTLSTITAIKLDELTTQRALFEDGRAELLKDVTNISKQYGKVAMLLDRIDSLALMGKLDNHHMSLSNIRRFLNQARYDPSVSERLQSDWQSALEKELDVHSLKYEYASLYGKLVKEWLTVSDAASSDTLSEGDTGFEKIGRKEMHDQRATWEDYVFKAKHTDSKSIHTYLSGLFNSNKDIKSAYAKLKTAIAKFELDMARSTHFNEKSLDWVIKGLLRSDLVTDEKRKILKDFLNNKVVLAEIADVLNMRMSSLDKWQWASEGTPVEQRRMLNGRYRFYHDEDLLQSILLRYIGVKWSTFFKTALTNFQSTSDVWKSSSTKVPASDRDRRKYFLGTLPTIISVESRREDHFRNDIFLDHLQDTAGEQRGGYDDDSVDEEDTRKSSQDVTQCLLHVLATEIILKTRLGEDICVVRSDFKWFGPSLPHSTIFAVLQSFGVSSRWIDFFRRALEAPMKFKADGDDAQVRTRKRGTPISGPLSDMLGETVLFTLDFAMNQYTDGARLYRLHDDIWFWGGEKTCVKGWAVMSEFAQLMGLEFNEEKTGSVRITRKPDEMIPSISSKLPKGNVRWGFLRLDAATGRFLIDQDNVDKHIEELRRQLSACKSIFDWIQAWNVYGARFFTNNFGRPANCYGLAHVDMMLETFARIQSKLFASTGGSVTSTLKQMLMDRFGVQDIPEGYLYYPMSMGGLDLKSPFVNLYLIHNRIAKDPDKYLDDFFIEEENEYRIAKKKYDDGIISRTESLWKKNKSHDFMSFEEFTRYREQTSYKLAMAYESLSEEPEEDGVEMTKDVAASFGTEASSKVTDWGSSNSYYRWIIQLYAPDMIARFGGLRIVETGLLPTAMVTMFRESRFQWQG